MPNSRTCFWSAWLPSAHRKQPVCAHTAPAQPSPYTLQQQPQPAGLHRRRRIGTDRQCRGQAADQRESPADYGDLLTASDGIYFGFTLKSFWQVYNHEISAPFRETNYRRKCSIRHRCRSRSARACGWGASVWNTNQWPVAVAQPQLEPRLRHVGVCGDNWLLGIQPWYRFPEDAKPGNPARPAARIQRVTTTRTSRTTWATSK